MASAGVEHDVRVRDESRSFVLPPALEAGEPPEARGLARDEVRLLVSHADTGTLHHARFRDLTQWLSSGDLLVVNTSGTLNAALPAQDRDGRLFELHLSTGMPGGFWIVELRQPGPVASLPFLSANAGAAFDLPGGACVQLLAPYPFAADTPLYPARGQRLWLAALSLPSPVHPYLSKYGVPIRYSYVKKPWPNEWYQTVFVTEPGSAEMPSAGRPFTPALVTALVARGVEIAPLLLHTGVASLEDHEPPYEEFYRVPPLTAERVTAAHRSGRRVIAVGTTAVRALETVTDERGTTSPGEGWTRLLISRARPLRVVTGLLTGMHEPRATHLLMAEQAIVAAGGDQSQLDRAYAEALKSGYLWHEFGDAHLILGAPT